MKKGLKIFSIIFISILVFLYLSFIFVLPNCINLNKYEPDIKKMFFENTGFLINTENIKLSTGWNLSAGIKADRIDVLYPNHEKFLQVKNPNVKLSILPLLIKKIQIDSITAENIILRMGVEKDGKFYIEKYLKPSKNQEVQPSLELPFGIEFSNKMPVINIEKYSISLIDIQTKKFYTFSGDNFKISNFILNEKIKISSSGKVVLDKKEHIKFNINLFSKVFPNFSQNKEEKSTQNIDFNILYYIKALKDINLLANINADLKLSGDISDIKTDGFFDITNFSLKSKNQQLPQSYIKTSFTGNKVSINSNLNISNIENISVNGYFKYGKNQYIDLTTKSDKISLSNLFDIVNSLSNALGNSDIKGISANGNLRANFNIKSDFKKINSSGYLKIDNANILYKAYNIAIKNINSDIDFSRNQIDIRKTSATINDAPISLIGAINTNAYANLNLKADKLPIKGLVATFGMVNILKDNNINSGIITLDGKIKGNLLKTKPHINVLLENVNIYNKPLKTSLVLTKGLSDMTFTKDNKINGNVLITNLKVNSPDFGLYSLPSTKLAFDDKNFFILPSNLYFNNSKIDFKGNISNYADKNNLVNIQVYGLILAKDLKSLVPKEFRQDILASGKIPLILRIKGNLNSQNITAQALSNSTNYISYGLINSLLNKTTLLNLSLNLSNNILKINDISLNALNSNKGLSENFSVNMSNSTKIASVNGNINELQNKYPQLNNIKINIPNYLFISLPSLKNSKIQAIGFLTLHGSTKMPTFTGQITIPVASFPSLKTEAKDFDIVFNKNNINVTCPLLNIYDSSLGFNTVVDNDFAKGIKIKSMNLNAPKINLDTLILALSNLPQNSVGQGTDLGITLANGKGKIQNFMLAGIKASDITANFVINDNSLKISNINGFAYNGKIIGDAIYNLVFGNIKLNLQGRGLSAEPAISDFTKINNLLFGALDFDASNISLIAGTEEQMMQSLRGNATFIVSNGQMGSLGKLEHLLYAQNILGNNLLKNSLGSITKAVTIKKTGDFKYIKGKMSFSNGWANIKTVQTSGPAMSLYLTGKYNLLNNNINATMLGRVSNDVVEVLGPVGEFSFSKLLSYIPKFGSVSSGLVTQLTTNPNNENVSMLPKLTPDSNALTKEFKVVLNGNVESTSAIKSFKWLSNPTIQTQEVVTTQQNSYTKPTSEEIKQKVQETIRNKSNEALNKILTPKANSQQKQQNVADFINNLPELKY